MRFRFRLLLSAPVSGVDAAADVSGSKMTKLQLLNAYLTERLTVVVKEILDVVEDTVTEYREETARTRRENESLRRQLRDILLLGAETEWLSKGPSESASWEKTTYQTVRKKNVHLKRSTRFDVKFRSNVNGTLNDYVQTESILNSAHLKFTDSVQIL